MSKKMHDAALRESRTHAPQTNLILIKSLDDELQRMLKYERRSEALLLVVTFFSFLLSSLFTCLFLYLVYTHLH